MEQVKRKQNNFILLLVIVLLCIVVGLILLIGTISRTRKSLYESTDSHLIDMANIVDNNINRVKGRCISELNSLVNSNAMAAFEKEYVEQGVFDRVQNKIKDNSLLVGNYAIDMIVKNGDVAQSVRAYDISAVDFSNQKNDGSFWFSIDGNTGKAYLMISTQSMHFPEVSYIVVLDFQTFYNRVAINTVLDEYWSVLYDESNNLVIETISNDESYFVITREEMEARKDGYGEILYCEDNRINETITYSTVLDGANRDIRMYVKSSGQSQNQVFAIAVAVFQNGIDTKVRSWTISLFVAALLIVGSICCCIFYALHSGERERELANEIKALETENELINQAKEAQEEVFHHKRLETLGTLTAGIAHEFNNMLSPIMADSLLALENTPEENTDVYDNLVDIYNSSRKAKDLVSRITRLSRKTPETAMKNINPETIIDDTLSMMLSSIPKNITIEKTIETDRFFIGSESQIGYMFLNLILNAIQAMDPNGGIISIHVMDKDDDIAFVFEDEGPGIPEDIINSIFEPFYTTKAAGKGTGLGLSIAANTVADHGGSIEAENREGGGARFTVLLKAVKDQE